MTEQNNINTVLKLINDEKEAIDGYIKSMETCDFSPEINAKLTEIMNDEKEHIKELIEILMKI